MTIGTILIVLLILALLGGVPTGGYGYGWYGGGGIGLVLVIIVVLVLLGRI